MIDIDNAIRNHKQLHTANKEMFDAMLFLLIYIEVSKNMNSTQHEEMTKIALKKCEMEDIDVKLEDL